VFFFSLFASSSLRFQLTSPRDTRSLSRSLSRSIISSRSSSIPRCFESPLSRSETPAPTSRGGKTRESNIKVRENDFPPVVQDIAVAAKSFVRTMTIYDQTFPSSKGTAKLEFAWKTVTELVKVNDNQEWKEALQDLKHDPITKKKLITFVSCYIL